MNVGEEEKFYPHAEVLPPTEPVSQWTITEKKTAPEGGVKDKRFWKPPGSSKQGYTP